MADAQVPKRIGPDLFRMVSLFDQSGHSVTADTAIDSVAHDGAGPNFPSGSYKAQFVAPFDGVARIAYALGAADTVKILEKVSGGSTVSYTLADGASLQAGIVSWPVSQGMVYDVVFGTNGTLYRLIVDAIKE